MTINTRLIIFKDEDSTEPAGLMGYFSLPDSAVLWRSKEALLCPESLEKMVFLIARKPKSLISHVQRIYYCFQNNLSDQLYAALIDFLVLLDKRGKAVSWRMVMGAKSCLKPDQFSYLLLYLKDNTFDAWHLQGNQYSIFTKGLIGINKMIQRIETSGENIEDDPLLIAQDHIEYSQLGEAKQVLERAVLEKPERLELQHELLELYKSTRDAEGFNQMLALLNQQGEDITDEWNQLNNFFKGQNSNG